MINLKIDPEFQSQIPPLTDDESVSYTHLDVYKRQLELRVDFQVDHSHTPLSLLLRWFFLPEKGRNILLCGCLLYTSRCV